MAITKSELNIIISARDAKMQKVFERAEKRAERFEKKTTASLSKTGKGFSKLGKDANLMGVSVSQAMAVLGSAATIAALKRLTTSSFNAADAIEKASISTGLSIENIQKYTFAGEQMGIKTEFLVKAFDRFNKRLNEFNLTGKGPGSDGFEALGISSAFASGEIKNADQAMEFAIKKLLEYETSGEQAAMAAKLFGALAGPEMTKLLAGGSVALEKWRDTAVIMSEDTVRSAVEVRDEWTSLITTMETAAQRFFLNTVSGWRRMLGALSGDLGAATDLSLMGDSAEVGRDLKRLELRRRELEAAGQGGGAEAQDIIGRQAGMQKRLDLINAEITARKKISELEAGAGGGPGAGVGGASRGGGSSGVKTGKAPLDERLDETYGEEIKRLIEREELIGKTAAQQARLNAENALRNRLETEAGDAIDDAGVLQKIEELVVVYGDLTVATFKAEEAESKRQETAEEAQEAAKRAVEESQRAVDVMVDGFFNATQGADNFKDALKQVGLQLAQLAASDFLKGLLGGSAGSGIFKSVFSGIGSSLAGSFSGGASTGGGFSSGVPLTFAKGGAFANGIVNGPTSFSTGGRPALMGESGPEAIMPLSRGPGGRLGVESSGGGQHVHVTVDAGPEFDVKVEQTAGRQTAAMIGQNNKARDRGFPNRFKAADSEIRKDNR